MSRRHDFAPGVIEAHRRSWLGTPAQRRELGRWLAIACVAAAAAGVWLVPGWTA